MTFPSNPNDNDIHTAFGRRLKYKGSTSTWEVVSSPSVAIETEAPVANTAVSSSSDLPLTGNEIGAMSYSQDTNTLYVWNGTGWFKIALVNTNPSISGGVESTYATSVSGDPITITVTASDPEGVPLTWSHTVTSGTVEDTTITNVDNVFTVTPGATATSFNVTFTASDGVNTDTSTTTIAVALPWGPQGSTYGYHGGGYYVNRDRFAFASTANATSITALPYQISYPAGNSSPIAGYYTGGINSIPDGSSPYTYATETRRFPFASDGSITVTTGILTVARAQTAGISSETSGYVTGGTNVATNQTGVYLKSIDKFSFAADTPGTNIGSLPTRTYFGRLDVGATDATGVASSDNGYVMGGTWGQTGDQVDKFSFATDAITGSVATMTVAGYGGAGLNSTTHGYMAGRGSPLGNQSVIDKFSFASEGALTNVGDLRGNGRYLAGTSSTVDGIVCGLNISSNYERNRVSFASDGNAVFSGYLVNAGGNGRDGGAGQQV